jgi:N4-gp56 family major capsid protein
MPDRNTNTLESVSAEAKTFYDKTLLARLVPALVFAKYGQKKSLKSRSGKTIEFRKFTSLDVASKLSEGVTPAGKNLAVTAITATVEQYGDFVEISDMLDLVGIDPVLVESAELLGEQAGLTIDNAVRDIVCAGTNVQYAGGKEGTNAITASDVMTADEVARAAATLKKGNVKRIDGKFYIGIVDPDIAYDLMKDPLWQDISKYSGGQAIMDGEIGKLHGVRFVETTETLVKEGTVNVHCAMIIGKDAYGIVDVNGSVKPENIVKAFGSAGTADPLNQRATSGWKALFTAKRLDENCMVRIECATTLD